MTIVVVSVAAGTTVEAVPAEASAGVTTGADDPVAVALPGPGRQPGRRPAW